MSHLDYWLTTPRLRVDEGHSFEFAEARLRVLSDDEADRTREAMTRRLMGPARATDTYAPKVELFRGTTSLALRLAGSTADHSTLREIGRNYEVLVFLSEAFALRRSKIHRLLGIGASQQHPSTDLVLPAPGRRWHYSDKFSTRTVRHPTAVQGLQVNERTKNRFKSLGFLELAPLIVRPTQNSTLKRVQQALRWLDHSILEKDPSAAAIKTCIGLESLFGFDKGEPLRQSISDRAAFLIARSAADRPTLARVLRNFYDHRSSIVHGGKASRTWTEETQQRVDRILLVSATCLASLSGRCPSVESLREYFDSLKWASTPSIPTSPVTSSLLKRFYAGRTRNAKAG